MEINITSFFRTVTPCELSGSCAELGQNAGAITWNASVDASKETMILDTDEKKDAFRAFVADSGGWTEEEIAAWSDVELNALFLQWIAGDMREMGIDEGDEVIDWADIEARQSEGQMSGNIFRGVDGEVYFYAGS